MCIHCGSSHNASYHITPFGCAVLSFGTVVLIGSLYGATELALKTYNCFQTKSKVEEARRKYLDGVEEKLDEDLEEFIETYKPNKKF